jgi:hypothetical protein
MRIIPRVRTSHHMPTLLCSECDRLLLIHTESIREHTRIVAQHHQARIDQDLTAVASLIPIIYKADQARRAAREAVMAHQGEH